MNTVDSSPTTGSLTNELRELSGVCGQTPWDRWGYFISNDTRFFDIADEFRRLAEGCKGECGGERRGIALCIGQGAIFSLMPDIPSLTTVLVDINPAVPAFAEVVQDAIVSCSRPAEAMTKILDTVATASHTERAFASPSIITQNFTEEKFSIGELHWTDPDRFEQVKAAVIERPVVPVVADVTDKRFTDRLSDICEKVDGGIVFANYTNLVEFRQVHYGLGSEGLKEVPLGERAIVLFSSSKNAVPGSTYPRFRLAVGASAYFRALEKLAGEKWWDGNRVNATSLRDTVWR